MTVERRPLILLRGFGGPDLEDERQSAYQGFNDGTVYPARRGENHIYEGFVLRALKSALYPYVDATNVVGYHPDGFDPDGTVDGRFDEHLLTGQLALDPRTADSVLPTAERVTRSLWVYRFYDLPDRTMGAHAKNLWRLLAIIRALVEQRGAAFTGVDIVAHSMGGLIVRDALAQLGDKRQAQLLIHRIVTLGTPHRGIAFQQFPGWLLRALPVTRGAADELEAFAASSTAFLGTEAAYPIENILTVVGTNYHTYRPVIASRLNRLSNLLDGRSSETNRSDGLVEQSAAQLPGAPRTFVHKCHGGPDSLITSRESYEIAMRFFHGSHHIRLRLHDADITRGADFFGSSEFYFGVRVKPRFVDFELFHQSGEAENCYGPFRASDLTDDLPDLARALREPLDQPGDPTTGWAGPDRLVWEGWIDQNDRPGDANGLVLRFDITLAERDRHGIGFSDNIVFHKQYYIQAFTDPGEPFVYVHTGEKFLGGARPLDRAEIDELAGADPSGDIQAATRDGDQWHFEVLGTGFRATLALGIRQRPATIPG